MYVVDVHPPDSGNLALAFANTADWHASAQPVETLTSYEALLDWGERIGLLDATSAALLHESAQRDPAAARAALARAIELRESIYRIFAAIAHRRPPDTADLDLLNAALGEAAHHLRIARVGELFTWGWADWGEMLDCLLWPIARAAAELLVSGELDRVRACANPPCGWLFIDRSRNRSRRWCDMRSCGNRMKARRHYQRKKQAASRATTEQLAPPSEPA
ncbi:ABATE domain-containing protein [Thermomicrobiaceae bacterium CFH 74404]|uniref:ABATE domain-containing protein n=3 Tax=Thermomicrobia TaxID=189775 RepID=A0AA41WJB7_9BACT|nr:ABATE domain-containing protein [Thermalbibacter longus]MCM8750441.1 ABATE domain-containing protein [Thermalbibacter longus]